MKFAAVLTAVAVLTLLCSASTGDELQRHHNATSAAQTVIVAPAPSNLPQMTTLIIDKKQALREQLRESMQVHDEQPRAQETEFEIQKELQDKNLILQLDPGNRDQELMTMRRNGADVREWVAAGGDALSGDEEAAKTEARHRSGAAFVHGDGASHWPISGLEEINRFFLERFGRSLPISALGQSPTHDRLGLDHRQSVDVAVRPDSVEGRDLIAYLREMGIPFRAFHGKLSSVSTGAHIHIGRPSPRLVTIKRRHNPTQERDEIGDPS